MLFVPFMFFGNLIAMVPSQATAAALIIVGYLMVSTLTEGEDEAEVEEGQHRERLDNLCRLRRGNQEVNVPGRLLPAPNTARRLDRLDRRTRP